MLSLHSNQIEDDGASALMALLLENEGCRVRVLDLSRNRIGPDGAKAVAAVCAVVASVTECNLRANGLGVEGWTIVFNALRDSPTSKIATWDLSYERLGPEIAKPLAEYISVTASMTRLDVRQNLIGEESKAALHEAFEGRSGFELLL